MPDSSTQPEVVALVPDLFFASKVIETARHVGVKVRLAQTPGQVFGAEANPAMVILDLHATGFDPVEFVRDAKSRAEFAKIPIVAFVRHTRPDLIAAAEAAGCQEVLARSAFTDKLGDILRSAAAPSDVSG
jgi:DNA-binding NarL/FixJ family response regulator